MQRKLKRVKTKQNFEDKTRAQICSLPDLRRKRQTLVPQQVAPHTKELLQNKFHSKIIFEKMAVPQIRRLFANIGSLGKLDKNKQKILPQATGYKPQCRVATIWSQSLLMATVIIIWLPKHNENS
jgi:hypothetical protein